ncbi:unnamed protein product [Closterium sp. Naga37s-1]|nr:unnamed protein product [Closterium sp. Naga37s-1]
MRRSVRRLKDPLQSQCVGLIASLRSHIVGPTLGDAGGSSSHRETVQSAIFNDFRPNSFISDASDSTPPFASGLSPDPDPPVHRPGCPSGLSARPNAALSLWIRRRLAERGRLHHRRPVGSPPNATPDFDLLDREFDAKVAPSSPPSPPQVDRTGCSSRLSTGPNPSPSLRVRSIALAAPAGALPDPTLLFLFGSGAILLRGAGCTINDLLDRGFDAKVARTRSRPLPSGAVTPLGATSFLGLQLLLGLGILVQLNTFSQVLGAASLPLVFSYPLMKRFTHWPQPYLGLPQAYLGLVFNWGALLGWAAVHGSLHLPAVLPLYMGGICWTLVYDTIYAHQDKADDITAGVKSTALLFAHHTPLYLSLFSAAAITSLAAAGSAVNLGSPFYASLAAAAAHMAWQIASTDYDSREDCYSKFASNWTFGALVFAGIVAGKLFGV